MEMGIWLMVMGGKICFYEMGKNPGKRPYRNTASAETTIFRAGYERVAATCGYPWSRVLWRKPGRWIARSVGQKENGKGEWFCPCSVRTDLIFILPNSFGTTTQSV